MWLEIVSEYRAEGRPPPGKTTSTMETTRCAPGVRAGGGVPVMSQWAIRALIEGAHAAMDETSAMDVTIAAAAGAEVVSKVAGSGVTLKARMSTLTDRVRRVPTSHASAAY